MTNENEAKPAFCIVGIDPGLSGAVGFYFPTCPDKVSVYDMPIVGKEVNGAALARLVQLLDPDLAVVEQVSSRPGQGVSSTFRFGASYGVARGVLSALTIPTILVSPSKWKRHYGLGSDKEASRALAIRYWPAVHHFERKKDHGRAEAALLARWAAETKEVAT